MGKTDSVLRCHARLNPPEHTAWQLVPSLPSSCYLLAQLLDAGEPLRARLLCASYLGIWELQGKTCSYCALAQVTYHSP